MMADDKRYITVKAAAKFLGMDENCLRQSIYGGNCRFGIGMKKEDMYGKNGFCKIPKLVFYKWCKGELKCELEGK